METPYALYDALSAIDVPPEKIRVVVQSMERDMALYATQSQFTALDRHSGSRFEQIDRQFDAMRREMNESLQTIEQRLIVRLGSFMAVAVAVTAGLVKLLSG